MNIATAAAPIIAVAIQPRTISGRLAVKAPITDFFETRMIITTISGTATTPLMTALQNRAFIGLIGEILDTESGKHADGDDAVEPPRIAHLAFEPLLPTHHL